VEHALTFVKVAAVFAAVVVARKRKAPMGLALGGGGLAIALLMGRTPAWIARELAGGLDAVLFSPSTCQFVAVIGCTIGLSTVLERAGQIERLTNAFRACFASPRVTLVALPAIIGFLPMPGGALFSAPMVEAAATGTGLDKQDKTLINYWFRHVWEYAWPLYPGVMITSQLLGIEVRWVSLAQAPMCVAAILAGLVFLRGAGPAAAPREAAPRGRAALDAAIVLLPFAVIVGVHLAAGLSIVLATGAGLALAAVWHAAARHVGTGALLRSLFASRAVLGMLVMAYGAKVFGELMVRSGAIAGIAALLQSMSLPLLLLAVALPFCVAFFSGITIVYVMTTFPVLIATTGTGAQAMPVIALAYAAGYCGTLLSPVHSCFVVSTAYWQSEIVVSMRRLLIPCAIVLATGAALMLVLRSWVLGSGS